MGIASITHRRMRNSRVTGVPLRSAADVVRLHGAMQAQDYGPAKWSIGQRSRGLSDGDIDDAVARGAIVRTHALRPTWHFLASDDVRWILALSGPRVLKTNEPRHRQLGLDAATLSKSERVIASALAGRKMTRREISVQLRARGIDVDGQRLVYMLMHCELIALICSGGLSGNQQTYALLDEHVAPGPDFDREHALAQLIHRYLSSHGPASLDDIRWWSGLTVVDIKQGLHLLGSEVEEESIDGAALWSLASELPLRRTRPQAQLLQAYDELIVGYRATRYFADPHAARAHAAWKGRTLPSGVVLMDGALFGHWKRTRAMDSVRVEVLAYRTPTEAERTALEAAVARIGRFLRSSAELEIGRAQP